MVTFVLMCIKNYELYFNSSKIQPSFLAICKSRFYSCKVRFDLWDFNCYWHKSFPDHTHTYYLEFYYNKTQAIPSSSHWSIFIYTTAATSAICYHVIYHQTSYEAIRSNDFRTEGAVPLQKQLWPANEKKTAARSCCTGKQ